MAVKVWRNDELAHHGILGQKWGKRNYQNPDGTLTEEGKARYRKRSDLSRKEKEKYDKKIEELNRDAQQVLKLEKSYEAKKASDKKSEEKASYKEQAQGMTEQELKDYINRQNLENTYVDLVYRDNHYKDKGQSWIKENWNDLATLTLSAIGAGVSIWKLLGHSALERDENLCQ